MTNIRKENGVIKAVYNGIEYIFNTVIELIISISTLRNIEQWQAKQREIDQINVVM